MDNSERRQSDRRRAPRGGRRTADLPGRHPRLIVADSYEGALRPCSRYLDHFAFDVAAVSDSQGVLAELNAQRPALILMDTKLRNPSALELITGPARGIPVILMEDAIDEPDAPQSIETSNAAAVLVKPFALGTMMETIRAVLRAQSAVSSEYRAAPASGTVNGG